MSYTLFTPQYTSATAAWIDIIKNIMRYGGTTRPRGMNTLELLHNAAVFPMAFPVVRNATRKLSYKFMAAEAYWILKGDNTVEGIAPYNKHIAQFSDDGEIFNGAYGPPINEQLPYVVDSLVNDHDSRQAVLTIWKPSPKESKDIPCTVSMTFNIRDRRLNAHVFMRSSDAWLGVPYDFFNFTMVATRVAYEYNMRCKLYDMVGLGNMHWTAVSSHLYDRNWQTAENALREHEVNVRDGVLPRQRAFPFSDYIRTPNGYQKLLCELDHTRQYANHHSWIRYGK